MRQAATVLDEATGAAERPHARYRLALREPVRALAPASVLDVGCGHGELLRWLRDAGCARCVGLERDAEVAAEAQTAGLDVQRGEGERLPFDDASFDVVTMEYVAHHLADLGAALREAARVARVAVMVLDGWYDPTIASQRVARRYDDWSKALDRAGGMIHNPCPSAAALAGPLLADGRYAIEIGTQLRLQPLSVEDIAAEGAARLAEAGGDVVAAAELEAILREARRHGFTDDGAITLLAYRR